MKEILTVLLIVGGVMAIEPGFSNFIGSTALLIGGMAGGYMDGKRAGRREAFGGEHENPIK